MVSDERDAEVRCPFPGTPQISTLLKRDQPASKEAIVRLYVAEFLPHRCCTIFLDDRSDTWHFLLLHDRIECPERLLGYKQW